MPGRSRGMWARSKGGVGVSINLKLILSKGDLKIMAVLNVAENLMHM